MTNAANTTPSGWIDIGGSAATNLLQSSSGNDWAPHVEEIVSVPSDGSYYLAFFWKNNASTGTQPPAAIDNVLLKKVDCTRPADINVAAADVSANITWSGYGDRYNVKVYTYAAGIGPDSDQPKAEELGISGTNIPVSDLDGNTQYIVFVQAVCEGEDGTESVSAWVSKTFKTEPVIAALPVVADFEDPAKDNIWLFSHSTTGTNKWAIGTAAKKDGSRGLYVSNNSGTSNAYEINSYTESYSYAYVPVSLQAGTEYTFTFDWKGNGEGSYSYYDLARAFLIPASANIANGAPNGMTSYDNPTPSGWIDIGGSAATNLLLNQAEWQHVEKDVSVQSSGVYYIAFFWKNDGTAGTNPPAAIDNVIFSEVQVVEIEDEICAGYSYEENHFNISADEIEGPGEYEYSTVYIDEADGKKILNLTLTVTEGNINEVPREICEGEEVVFFGRQLAPARGEYTYSHYTYSLSNDCDSVVRLSLTVNPSYHEYKDTVLLQSQLPVTIGEMTFNPGMPDNTPFSTSESHQTAEGCDSIISWRVILTTGLNEIGYNTFNIVPNPVNVGGTVQIDAEFTVSEREGLKVEIINSVGAVIQAATPDAYPLTVSGFEVSGMYIVRVTTGTNGIYYGKVLVK
jgi:hypothetical protein